MGDNHSYGKLICEAPRIHYVIGKIMGVVFTIICFAILIIISFLLVKDILIDNNIILQNILAGLIISLILIIVLIFILIPLVTSQRFKIFENGIYPHIKPIYFWLKRQKYFIPFNELERIEVSKTTDGSKCILLYPKRWKRLLVEYSDTGDVVFDRLLEIEKKYKRNAYEIKKTN